MHNYKFNQWSSETPEEFEDRVQRYCDGKAVLAIAFHNDEEQPYAEVKSFEEL